MNIPKKWKDEIEDCVSHCRNCVPSDIEDIFITLREYLEGIEMPSKYFGEVDGKLECQFCRSRISLEDDIVERSIEEENYKKVSEQIGEYYADKLNSFSVFLENYPYLGLKHPIGIEISSEIGSLQLVTIEDQVWYRARRVSTGKIFHQNDMHAPDPNRVVISEGRFNHFGQSYLYLGNTENLCSAEINAKTEICWMQKVKIKKLEKILDLSNLFAPDLPELDSLIFASINYTRQISIPVNRDQGWKPEYFVPRFIGDLAKDSGINAIRFRSSIDSGDNVVVFSLAEGDLEFVEEPYLYKYVEEEILF